MLDSEYASTHCVGVVGLRRLTPRVGEMKRLYVRPVCRALRTDAGLSNRARAVPERVLDPAYEPRTLPAELYVPKVYG